MPGPQACIAPRPRNAAATRAAILDAARTRFARESYDDVGMRDLARDVGVDAALVSRYFGSKEELFSETLDSCSSGGDLLDGDRATWGARVADQVVYGKKDEQEAHNKLQGLLIMLRSVGSARANELVKQSAADRFYGPFAVWVGGSGAAVRARLAIGLIMGLSISREMTGGFNLSPEECAQLRDRLAVALQGLLDG